MKTYKTHKAYGLAVKRAMTARGIVPVKAHYDYAGNCIYCGEAGRCPQWHDPNDQRRIYDAQGDSYIA